MLLFLDRLPFHRWTDQTRTPPRDHWSVVLPVLLGASGELGPPVRGTPQEWALDTGNRGEALAWRHHLLAAGLDPGAERTEDQVLITTALAQRERLPVRTATLWLLSNLPEFQGQPWPLFLNPGIAFRDVPGLPDPEFHRPLIGLRALRRAGLKAEIDFGRDTVSVWVPE